MLSVCIMLAFFVAVFPVSNGLLPKCDLTCNDPGPLSQFMRIAFYFFRTISIDCSIRTPHSSNCTLDVSDIIQSSCNQNESSLHRLKLVCDNTLYRPIITKRILSKLLWYSLGYKVWLIMARSGSIWGISDSTEFVFRGL